MSGWRSIIAKTVEELVSTPNGQVRLVGAILCLGPAYHMVDGHAASPFDWVMLGLGFFMIMLSAAMALWAQHLRGDDDGA